jgi:hypothetical protein
MAGELFFDFGTMSDDEIYDVVIQHLNELGTLDMGWIDVAVRDGHVTLSGRVGTDAEVEVAEKLLVEVLGIEGVTNELIVDELHRTDLPEAADEEVAAEEDADEQMGGGVPNQEDTASHLVEDLEAQTFGTRDMQQAIEEGASYNPPDLLPDGYGSRENH